jgi:hypothetical protein
MATTRRPARKAAVPAAKKGSSAAKKAGQSTVKRAAAASAKGAATPAKRGAGAASKKAPPLAAGKAAAPPSKKLTPAATRRAGAAAGLPAKASGNGRLGAKPSGNGRLGGEHSGNGRQPGPPSHENDWAILLDVRQDAQRRADALASLGWQILVDKPHFQSVLGIVRNRNEPIELRLAALGAVQSATFDANRFAAFRPDYLRALRAVCRDPDMELRQRVLGILARESDGPTQEALLEGLRDPSQALLPPEKALQLLSYDVHSEAYAVAREIAEHPPNALARREALRLLSADGESAPMFEKMVLDKSQPIEIRQLAASALHKLAPRRMQECARRITLDDAEDREMKSVSLTALANFADEQTRQDAALGEQVRKLQATASRSSGLARAAAQFLQRRPASGD